MGRPYVSAELRRLVRTRAERICEYCLIHESDTFYGCGIDHIISTKHGGSTTQDNLAYACDACNRHKGSDIASLSPDTGTLIRFFNPRTDRWTEHFAFAADGITIIGLTESGCVTVEILKLNLDERLKERAELRNSGSYPPPQVRRRMLGLA